MKDDAHACPLIQEALAGAGDDVEFKNQVGYYAARCSVVVAPAAAAPPLPTGPGPATATVTPASSPAGRDSAKPAAAAAPATGFSVQVLAVKSAVQVDELLTRLKVMGFTDARVVRDSSGFFKVRVGRYATHQDAQRAQQRLKTRLGGQPFVVEEP